MDESGEQFVAYFLPTEDTMRKRKRDAENGLEYEDEDEYVTTLDLFYLLTSVLINFDACMEPTIEYLEKTFLSGLQLYTCFKFGDWKLLFQKKSLLHCF